MRFRLLLLCSFFFIDSCIILAQDVNTTKIDDSYYELPDVVVNISDDNGRVKYLKVAITIELEKSTDSIYINKLRPKIIDQLVVFLRELKVSDVVSITTSDGKRHGNLIRLKEEIINRINTITKPLKIKDVLFKEVLVQ